MNPWSAGYLASQSLKRLKTLENYHISSGESGRAERSGAMRSIRHEATDNKVSKSLIPRAGSLIICRDFLTHLPALLPSSPFISFLFYYPYICIYIFFHIYSLRGCFFRFDKAVTRAKTKQTKARLLKLDNRRDRTTMVIFVAGSATQLARHLYSAFLHDHESNSARLLPLRISAERERNLTERATLSRANFNTRACALASSPLPLRA